MERMERENPATVVWHDDLLASHWIAPLLVAAAAAQDGDELDRRSGAESRAHPTITSMSLASCGRSMSEGAR